MTKYLFVLIAIFAIVQSQELCVNQWEINLVTDPNELFIVKPLHMGDHLMVLGRHAVEAGWVKVRAFSLSGNESIGYVQEDVVDACPEAPVWHCVKRTTHVHKEASFESEFEYYDVEHGSKFVVIEEGDQFSLVQGVVGYVAGHTGYVWKDDLKVCDPLLENGLMGLNRDAARAYAEKWWNSANHKCGKFSACTPYSYWGGEACNYKSQGGDCANLVSQSLIAGGHAKLSGGGDFCRGYPCGVEEIGARKLGQCLASKGWKSTCGRNASPPKNIKVGDVIIYHANSCTDFSAHATIVTKVTGGVPYISCHSANQHNAHYTYLKNSKPYYEFLTQ